MRILATLVVGIFFGFLHLQNPTGTISDWTTVIIPGSVGVFSGLLVIRYNSLYPAIFTHIFYNGIVASVIALANSSW